MKSRRLFIFLVILLFILSLAAGYLLGTPRLLQTSPTANASDIPTGAPVRLVFSRTMQAASVLGHLLIDPPQQGSPTWEGNTLVFTPSLPWPNGKTITVSLRKGARASGWLSLPTRQEITWSFTIGQPRLTYLYPADGAGNLYALDPLSGTSVALTDSPGGVLEYQVNANGTAIYYSVRNSDSGSDIYRLDLSHWQRGPFSNDETLVEETQALVVRCGKALCRAPQVSPQGDFLAYERTETLESSGPNYPRVWILPLASEREPTASSLFDASLAGEPGHQTLQPAWSADGLLAFYDTNLLAFVILDPKSGLAAHFANQTGQLGAWDPQGKVFVAPEISFMTPASSTDSGVTPIANSHLIQFSQFSSSVKDLSVTEEVEDTSPVFSPDGQTLAFARKFLDIAHWTPGRQLWLMNTDSSDARQLTNDPYFNHFEFAWSPDSSQLAFVRYNQTEMIEPLELWLIHANGSAAKRLVVGGYAPQWIP